MQSLLLSELVLLRKMIITFYPNRFNSTVVSVFIKYVLKYYYLLHKTHSLKCHFESFTASISK